MDNREKQNKKKKRKTNKTKTKPAKSLESNIAYDIFQSCWLTKGKHFFKSSCK